MLSKIKTKNTRLTTQTGFSLVELLVVIFIFSVIAIIATQAMALSLRSSKKSESIGKVRENVEFSLSTMERLLRNAKSATCSGNTIEYFDENASRGRFSCVVAAPPINNYIASGSAASPTRITGTDVIVDCTVTQFVCPPTTGVPQSITMTVAATAANVPDAEGSKVTSTTKMLLRNY